MTPTTADAHREVLRLAEAGSLLASSFEAFEADTVRQLRSIDELSVAAYLGEVLRRVRDSAAELEAAVHEHIGAQLDAEVGVDS